MGGGACPEPMLAGAGTALYYIDRFHMTKGFNGRLTRWRWPQQSHDMVGYFLLLLVFATNASVLLLFPFSLRRAWAVAGLYGLGTAAILVLLFHPRSQWLVKNRYRVACPGGRACVALTFDDGPSDETTPRVLEILRAKGVKATFFLVGREAERHPDLVRQMRTEGHAIGNHTFTHSPLFCFLTPARLRWEIERTQQVLSGITGARPRLFRSPVGLRHPFLARTLKDAGVEYISWQLRTLDTHPNRPNALRARILDRIAPGDIVLMHDRPARGTTAMISVLPEVIDRLRDRGYEFTTP